LAARWDQLLFLERKEVSTAKRWDISFLLFYPNLYRVGMANLGVHTIYRLINETPDMVCDRCFMPEERFFSYLDSGEDLVSIELKQTPREFSVLAFSVSFELDFLNLVRLLLWSKVAPLARERREEDPLVLIGGLVPSANPEPFAPVADVVVVGEGEEVLEALLDVLREYGTTKSPELLFALAEIPGVYVPSLYSPSYDCFGRFVSVRPNHETLASRIPWSSWSAFPAKGNVSTVVTSESSFPNCRLVEVSRGCPYLCKFCLAAHVCRPLRMVSFDRIASYLDFSEEKVGFVGTSVSHHPDMAEVVDMARSMRKEVTFSSLRLDAHLALLESISRVSRTVTFGVEAATEELREAVGKRLPRELIRDRLLFCVGKGAKVLKLYFMVGLPGETDKDLQAIITFPKQVFHWCKTAGLALPTVHLSISPFVPKPHTPFQWASMDTRGVLREKLKRIEAALKKVRGVVLTGEGPKWSVLQGVISRGDRRVGEALVLSVVSMKGNWGRSFRECNISVDFYLHRERAREEPFPWEIVDTGWHKEELWERWVSHRI
jgi:radical SAM superfamily enzyme YgiQ (UPF0313 family)